jgi:lysophospholipase L1-like esterase
MPGPPPPVRLADALVFWSLLLLLSPLLAVQAAWTLLRTPRLPEAGGGRRGRVTAATDQPVLQLLIAGESTAVGVGVTTLERAVAGRLAVELAERTQRCVHWQVVGANGARIGHLAALLAAMPAPCGVALALLPMGVNDTVKLTSLAGWRRGLQVVIDALRGAGVAHIAFASVPPVGWFTALPRPLRWVLGMRARQLDRVLLEWAMAAGEDVHFLPIRFPMAPQLLAADGYHPGEAGYRVWASLLADQLVASGALAGGALAGGILAGRVLHDDSRPARASQAGPLTPGSS